MICFSRALDAMKLGKAAERIKGHGWDGVEALTLKPDRREDGYNFYKQAPPFIGNIGIRFYRLTNDDILATNWRIIE